MACRCFETPGLEMETARLWAPSQQKATAYFCSLTTNRTCSETDDVRLLCCISFEIKWDHEDLLNDVFNSKTFSISRFDHSRHHPCSEAIGKTVTKHSVRSTHHGLTAGNQPRRPGSHEEEGQVPETEGPRQKPVQLAPTITTPANNRVRCSVFRKTLHLHLKRKSLPSFNMRGRVSNTQKQDHSIISKGSGSPTHTKTESNQGR